MSAYVRFAVAMATPLVLAPMIVHALGAESFGLWTTLGSIAGFIALLDLGLSGAIAKYVAQFRAQGRNDDVAELFSLYLWIYVGLGVVGAVLVVAAGPLVPRIMVMSPHLQRQATVVFVLLGLASAVGVIGKLFEGMLIGGQRIEWMNHVASTGLGVSLLLSIAALRVHPSLAVLASIAVGSASVLVAAYALLVRRRGLLALRWPKWNSLNLVRQTAPLGGYALISTVAAMVVYGTDLVIISAKVGVLATAGYGIALALNNAGRQLFAKVSEVLVPFLSDIDARSQPADLRRWYLTATGVSMAIGLAVGLVILVAGLDVARVWVGRGVVVVPVILVLLTIPTLVGPLPRVAGVTMLAVGSLRPVALAGLVEAAANLLLALLLVGPLGAVGVALATVIGQLLTTAWMIPASCNRRLQVPFRTYVRTVLAPPLASALPALAVGLAVAVSFVASPLVRALVLIPIVLITFAALYWLLGVRTLRKQFADARVGLRDVAAEGAAAGGT